VNLVIDIGNTQAKIALFKERELAEKATCSLFELHSFVEVLFAKYEIQKSILSAVANYSPTIIRLLESQGSVIIFDEFTAIPIKNLYKSPKSLGKDRLANAIGAAHFFKNEDVLSVDMGTCIKFDLVTKNGQYVGGSISPGLNMRFKSLNTFTDKLPLLNLTDNPNLVGTETDTSIQSGVQWGIKKEIEGVIAEYGRQYSQLKVVLTGGDHIYFAKAFKNSIFARPNLTLEGLNEVLIFNE
jgi:type III pantothenate kinase